MAFISDILTTIKNAQKGRDMRQAIHDGIEQCYKDATGHPDSVAAVVDGLATEEKERKTEVDVERKRIDELIENLPGTSGEYQQSKLVLHSYENTAVECGTTAGNYTNVPSFTTVVGGTLAALYTKKSDNQIAVNKDGLYLFALRVGINSLTANKRVELAPFVNGTRNAALASSHNTADNFTLTQIVTLPLWLSANDTVDFRIAPVETISVRVQMIDVSVYALDWDGKFQVPDYSTFVAETRDLRIGANGTSYQTAGAAVREQIKNLENSKVEIDANLEEEGKAADAKVTGEAISKLTEDLDNLESDIEFTITGYFASNGYHSSNEYFKSTDFVELVKDGIYIPLRYHLNGSNLQEILIYNKEKRVIKNIPLSPSSDYQVLDGVLEFEKDFYYAKFCSYSVDFDYWVKFDTIRNQIPYGSLKDGMIPRHEISMEKLTGMIHDPSTNFINPLDVNKGYVNNDGEFKEDDTWHNTGLIRFNSGKEYYWSGFYSRYYAFYDKNFKIVLKSTNPLSNPFTVPENAMYGLFSMDGDFSGCWIHDINKKPSDYAECLNVKNVYALEKKQGVENAGKVLSVNNEGNVVPTQLKNNSGTSTKIYKKGNLLKFDEIESGYIKADGTVQPYSTLWCTGFCEVEQGKVYAKGFLLSQYFAFYDGNKKVVKTYKDGAMQQYTPQIYCIDVPVNAKYFRCTANEDPRVATNNLFFVSNKAELPEEEDKLSFGEIFNYNVSPSNPCDYAELTVGVFNKCVFIGNSLTYGTFNMDDGASYGSVTSPQELADKYSYPSQFKKITGIDIINLGVAGATSVSWYNSHLDYNYSGCDMAIIHLGVNDAAFKISDTDTKAALVNIINSLKSSVKNIKIFLCTIIPAYSNVEQAGYRKKSEVIRELYNEKYKEDINVVLLDLEKYGHTKAYTSYTSGHLSALGYYVLARDIAHYISWHIDNNLRDYRFIQFIGNDGLYTGD